MRSFRYFFYLLFLSAGLYACSATRSTTKTNRDFDKFPATATLTETRLLNLSLSSPEQMILYKDSLLLVMNNLNGDPHHVRVVDIARKKEVNNLFPVSGKKGGTLAFMSFNISDSLVWVFDVAKNGFIVANLDTVLKSKGGLEYYAEYRLTPQVFYYDAVLLNRGEALLNGHYDTDEKLLYINLRDTTHKKQLLSYQQDSAIGTSRVKKMSYESFMLLKPDKKKLVLAGRYADQFELLDLSSGAYKKIRGPIGISPHLAPFRDNTGTTVGTPDESTLYGFLKGCVTQKHIYLLFSGYPTKTAHHFYGNKLFVFDWEGNPVKEIRLKKDIITFSVSSDDKTLYTLNPWTKAISVAELKWQ